MPCKYNAKMQHKPNSKTVRRIGLFTYVDADDLFLFEEVCTAYVLDFLADFFKEMSPVEPKISLWLMF